MDRRRDLRGSVLGNGRSEFGGDGYGRGRVRSEPAIRDACDVV